MFREKIFRVIKLTVPLLMTACSLSLSSPQYSRQELDEQSATCLDCHEGYETSLAGSAHRLSSGREIKSSIGVGCISCHKGWEKHLEEPSAETIIKLGALSLIDQAEVCGNCHLTPHQQTMVTTDPHTRRNISCFDCHTIHNNPVKNLVKDAGQEFCLTCHTEVASEFHRRSNHPLQSLNISCTDCHSIDNIKSPSLAVGHGWQCQRCHTDYAGPFLYEHPVVYNHLVNGGGCTECHESHGSPNDRLLKQPENGTCLQCHGVPPGHRTRHSGLGARLACVDCHSEIHGSYDNKLFLDPDLGNKLFPDCYQPGCHIINQ